MNMIYRYLKHFLVLIFLVKFCFKFEVKNYNFLIYFECLNADINKFNRVNNKMLFGIVLM